MYSGDDLVRQIREMGILSTDTIMVHTSLKSVGEIDPENGTSAEVYISALRECVSQGLLLIPAHTWDRVRGDGSVFDRRESVPCTGAVSKAAVQMANRAYEAGKTDCVRSKHPSHSVVAFGKRAAEYVKYDENVATPCPWEGCTGRLFEEKGKILLVGVDHGSNTFFHAVDEYLDLPNRLRSNPRLFTVRDYDGSCSRGRYYVHTGPFSEHYENYAAYLQAVGAVTCGRLADAQVRICDAEKCTHALERLWRNADHDYCAAKETLDYGFVQASS